MKDAKINLEIKTKLALEEFPEMTFEEMIKFAQERNGITQNIKQEEEQEEKQEEQGK